MANCKVLLLGSSGFLGSKIVETKPKNIILFLASRNNHYRVDLTDLTSFKKAIEEIRPNIVIHAARIEPFDNDPIKAEEITSDLVKVINSVDIKLIYISSDAVFDGKKGNYKEDDIPNPVTDYGKAKLAAENVIKTNCKDFIIIRTANIYGKSNGIWDKRNVALLNEIKIGKEIKRFSDVYRSFTLVDDLAKTCWRLVRSNFKGVINVSGKRKSFYEFSQEIAKELNINPDLIELTSLKESGLNIAPDTSLDTSLAEKVI